MNDRKRNDGLNSLNDKRKAHIKQVLETAGYDLVQAADLLRISVAELKRWMRKLGIPSCDARTETGQVQEGRDEQQVR